MPGHFGAQLVGCFGDDGVRAATKLLLHCDASPFVDSSPSAKVVTNTGTAPLDTTNKVFGAGSLNVNGTTQYLGLANSADWDFGTGDFTINFRIRRNGTQTAFGSIIGASDAFTSGWTVSWAGDGQAVTFFMIGTSGSVGDATPLSDLTWYDIAICRRGDSVRMFRNGVQVGITNGVAAVNFNSQGTGLRIGDRVHTAFAGTKGNIDEVCIIKGISLFNANYPVRTAAWP